MLKNQEHKFLGKLLTKKKTKKKKTKLIDKNFDRTSFVGPMFVELENSYTGLFSASVAKTIAAEGRARSCENGI